MTTFDDRNKKFEKKFAHDGEMNFKINARRNKLLGMWAADKMGLDTAAAEQYAKELTLADFESPGDSDVLNKILKDFENGQVHMSMSDVRIEMERLLTVARKQIMSDS
jgi:hypothetical protein